jgi:S-DNA-T family DNA segregation ATPase FtsK/SpoIIIE
MIGRIWSFYWTKAVILLLIAVVIILSIATYDQIDPSLNLATTGNVENILGVFGANLSDILLQSLGVTNLLLIFVLLNWSYLFLKEKELHFWYGARIFILVCSIALFSVFFNKFHASEDGILSNWMVDVDIGGVVGFVLKKYLPVRYIEFISLAVAIPLFCISLGYSASQYKTFLVFCYKIVATSLIGMINFAIKVTNFVRGRNGEYVDVKKFTPKVKKTVVSSKKFDEKTSDGFELPNLDLFNQHKPKSVRMESREQLQENAAKLLEVLQDFGIKGDIIDIRQGPVVTMYEFEPAAGTKSSRVIGLADDIARSLCALSTRIAVIPGRNVLGIELPNKEREFFFIKELFETDAYNDKGVKLPIILGKDLYGGAYVADLAKMPHLLVAGTTGSGKSVAINAMIVSLLFRYTPDECKFIMIDPKMLELSVYDGIPHLLTPVVTEPGKAITALKWAVKEMENRYRLMSYVNVRNIDGYNEKILQAAEKGDVLERRVQTGFDPETGSPIHENLPIENKKLPYIVLIVDEMADLMLVAGKDIEASIQRLAQMARAAGIHIIMATQRPSVDVITGVIKANFPSRISFKVTSKIDSRTIIGEQGSEQLLGMGDMLYMGTSSRLMRVHGPFIDDREVENIANFLKSQASPQYINAVTEVQDDDIDFGVIDGESGDLYARAVDIVKRERKASTSFLQRCLKIGYNRAADLIDQMEKRGVVSPANHVGKREILVEDA